MAENKAKKTNQEQKSLLEFAQQQQKKDYKVKAQTILGSPIIKIEQKTGEQSPPTEIQKEQGDE